MEDKTIDPVCGEAVRTKDFAAKYEDEQYYFCGMDCLAEFIEDPDSYAGEEVLG